MKSRRLRLSLYARNAWTAQLFLLPFYLGLIFFFLSPLIQSVYISFCNVSVSTSGYRFEFIGIQNYRDALWTDANFTTNLVSTLTSMLWKVPVILFLSLFMAMIVNQKFRGRVFVRAVFFLPVIFASGVVLNMIQSDSVASLVLSGSNSVTGGSINQSDGLRQFLIDSGFGHQIVDIATSVANNMFSLVWRSGLQMIIFLAGLQSIPSQLYEVSAIEGASSWESFWKITLPMLSPIFFLNVVYTIVDNFTDSGNSIMMQITNLSAQQVNKMGLSSAFAWCYFLLVGIVLLAVLLIYRKSHSDSM